MHAEREWGPFLALRRAVGLGLVASLGCHGGSDEGRSDDTTGPGLVSFDGTVGETQDDTLDDTGSGLKFDAGTDYDLFTGETSPEECDGLEATIRDFPASHPDFEVYTGNDASVDGYVMGFEDSAAFLEKVKDLLSFLMPRYGDEGKVYLTLAFGCTGGRHRSVTLANRVGEWLRQRGTRVQVRHRDIDR